MKENEKLKEIIISIMTFYDDELRFGKREFDTGDNIRLKQYISQIKNLRGQQMNIDNELREILQGHLVNIASRINLNGELLEINPLEKRKD